MVFYFERAGGAAVAVTGRVKKSALRAGARAAQRLQLQGALKIRPSSGRAGGAAFAVTGRVKNLPFERARGRRGGCSYRAP